MANVTIENTDPFFVFSILVSGDSISVDQFEKLLNGLAEQGFFIENCGVDVIGVINTTKETNGL